MTTAETLFVIAIMGIMWWCGFEVGRAAKRSRGRLVRPQGVEEAKR